MRICLSTKSRSLRIILTVGCLFSALPAYANFTDVPEEHPHLAAITYVQAKEMVSGYPDGKFRPDNWVNRAEFVKILVNAHFTSAEIQECAPRSTYSFPDAGWDEWYSPYLCLAVEKGIIQGYSSGPLKGYFAPAGFVNLAEAAKIVATTLRADETIQEKNVNQEAWWAAPYIQVLANAHAVPPSVRGGNYWVTRGEMAEILYRLITENTQLPSLTYGQIATVTSTSKTSAAPQTVPVFVSSDEQVTTITEEHQHCGSPAGSRHMEGTYTLKDASHGYSLAIPGKLSFNEGTFHDKTVHTLALSDSERYERFYAFAQYGSCNLAEIFVYRQTSSGGFDIKPVPFCRADGTCQPSVFTGHKWPVIKQDRTFETVDYSNITGKFTYRTWLYNLSQHRIEEIATIEAQE